MLLLGQGETLEEILGLADGKCRDLADIAAVDADRTRFRTQARSFAVGTSGVAAILAQHHAYMQLVFLALQKGEETMDAEKRPVTIEHKLLLGRGQFSPGDVERNAMLHGGLPEVCLVRAILWAWPRNDWRVVQRFLFIRDDQVEIEV